MDVELLLSRLRSLCDNVERVKAGRDEPYTLKQANNLLQQFSENFLALDEAIRDHPVLPQDWTPVFLGDD